MKTYTHTEADYTPNDVGPPDRLGINEPITEEERERLLLTDQEYY